MDFIEKELCLASKKNKKIDLFSQRQQNVIFLCQRVKIKFKIARIVNTYVLMSLVDCRIKVLNSSKVLMSQIKKENN